MNRVHWRWYARSLGSPPDGGFRFVALWSRPCTTASLPHHLLSANGRPNTNMLDPCGVTGYLAFSHALECCCFPPRYLARRRQVTLARSNKEGVSYGEGRYDRRGLPQMWVIDASENHHDRRWTGCYLSELSQEFRHRGYWRKLQTCPSVNRSKHSPRAGIEKGHETHPHEDDADEEDDSQAALLGRELMVSPQHRRQGGY